jgi:hypothetical protein
MNLSVSKSAGRLSTLKTEVHQLQDGAFVLFVAARRLVAELDRGPHLCRHQGRR